MSTWRDRAICTDMDPEIFFPRTGDLAGIDYARQICSYCPVIQECLESALAAEYGTGKDSRAGVFGGLSSSQRYNLYRASTLAPTTPHTGGKPVVPCGTYGAYQRHRRYREPVCDDCREAARLKSQQRRERARTVA